MFSAAVTGTTQLRVRTDALGRDLTDIPMQQVADAIAASARPPRRTGALARSVRATARPSAAIVTAGGGSVAYAGVVNRRTRFLDRAATGGLSGAVRTLTTRINTLIRNHNLT